MQTSYRFTQQVKIKDKVFSVGVHEVSEEFELDKDFVHFVRCGWISEAPPPVIAAQPVSMTAQAKKLAERIEKKLDANKEKIKADAQKGNDGYDPKKEPAPPAAPPVAPTGWDPTPVAESNGKEGTQPLSPVDESNKLTHEDDGGEKPEGELSPQQRAARTRKANAEKAKAEKAQVA